MKTQGGNLDYGLRQYVSAVEFKAGPLANPHAPRTVSKRAKTTIMQAQEVSGSASAGYALNLVLDDASLFPDVPFSRDSNNNAINEQGNLVFIAEIGTDTPLEVHYYGKLESNAGANTVQVGTAKNASFTIGDFIGAEFKLVRAGHAFQSIVNPANMITQELQTSTFYPSTSAEQWTFSQ